MASLVAGQLMADGNPTSVFGIIAGVLVAAAAITLGTTRETSGREMPATVETSISPRADLVAYPIFARFLVARGLVLLGIYVVQSFAQYYIRDWLRVPNATVVTGNLMATIGVALMLLVFPAGWLSDKVGRWTLNIAAGGVAAFGILLLVFARDVTAVYVFGGIIGMATGIFLSVNWALATDLIPRAEGGKFLGYTNFTTAGAGALSRLGGPLMDGVKALWPGSAAGHPVAFSIAPLLTLSGAILLARVRRQSQNQKESVR